MTGGRGGGHSYATHYWCPKCRRYPLHDECVDKGWGLLCPKGHRVRTKAKHKNWNRRKIVDPVWVASEAIKVEAYD